MLNKYSILEKTDNSKIGANMKKNFLRILKTYSNYKTRIGCFRKEALREMKGIFRTKKNSLLKNCKNSLKNLANVTDQKT